MELEKIKLPIDIPFFEDCCPPKERDFLDDIACGKRRDAISENKSKYILVYDYHKGFVDGINKGNFGHTSYRMITSEGEITLPHHDLRNLWVIK